MASELRWLLLRSIGTRFDVLAVIPGHPAIWRFCNFGCVQLRLVQVLERIGPIQLAGVDQTHLHVADASSVAGFVEHRVPAMLYGFL